MNRNNDELNTLAGDRTEFLLDELLAWADGVT
jgi:hypothetical protein